MFFSFPSQEISDQLFAGVAFIVFVVGLIISYVTYKTLRHFGLNKLAVAGCVFEVIAVLVLCGLIMSPVINFYLHSAV